MNQPMDIESPPILPYSPIIHPPPGGPPHPPSIKARDSLHPMVCQLQGCNNPVMPAGNRAYCCPMHEAAVLSSCDGCAILALHTYRRGMSQAAVVTGSDRSRRHYHQAAGHNNIIFELPGGRRDGNEHPIDCAIREYGEELGLQLDEGRMREALQTAPIIVKRHRENPVKYFLTYVIHMENLSTRQMRESWKHRMNHGVLHHLVEMDLFFHVYIDELGRFCGIHANDMPASSPPAIERTMSIFQRDRGIFLEAWKWKDQILAMPDLTNQVFRGYRCE